MVWMLVFALLFDRPSPGRPDGAGLDALLELIAGSGVDERFQAEVRDRLGPGTSALFLALGPGSPTGSSRCSASTAARCCRPR